MPFAKIYEPWEVRELMQKSEGKASPLTGADAHARVLHAASSSNGKVTGFDAGMLDRTHKRTGESNNQFKNRGGTGTTSAFNNVIFQSAAVTQALNSAKGQAALSVLDNHDDKELRLVLQVSGIEQSDTLKTGQGPGMRTSSKNAADLATLPGAAGVKVIIDKGKASKELLIQTCFPLDVCPASSYSITDCGTKTELAAG